MADRIIGFRHWAATVFGAQAVAMLALFGNSLDESMLRERLRAEGAEDALDPLRLLAADAQQVTEERLEDLLEQLRGNT